MGDALALVTKLVELGPTALVAFGFVLVVLGILRPGKLVDAERDRILAERDKREAEITAARDRREAQLIAERDVWRDRSLATEDRLDRVVRAFERLAQTAAPE